MKTKLLSIVSLALLALAVTGVLGPHRAASQEAYPSKPVTVWVGFPPGGGTDILTRALAEGAEKSLGQKVIVINKPGAGGAVATAELAKARPDGYTLVSNTDTPFTRAPHLRNLDYEPFRDLTYIMRYARYKLAWSVREDSPFKTWRDLIEWAKQNPGQLTFGHPGTGTSVHLATVRIAALEGITIKSIPFGGDAPAITALLGGHVTLISTSSVAIASYVQAKRMRVLLVNEQEGLDYAPDAITLEKAGYTVETATPLVVVGPPALPRPVAERLERAFVDALQTEPFMTIAKRTEVVVGEPLTGQALVEYLRKISANYEELIKEAGLYKAERK